MARRRLNTGFLLPIGCGALLFLGGAYGLYKWHKPHNPATYITAGDAAMKIGDYNVAAANYSAALDQLPEQVDLHVKLGKCYLQLQHAGIEHYRDAVGEFTAAEERDPKNIDAWVGLLDISEFEVGLLESHARDDNRRQILSQQLDVMRDAADHLAQLQPENIQALSVGPILTLRLWILNMTMPESAADRSQPMEKRLTPDQRADQAVATLNKLMVEHPENDQIPFWLARAKIFQAQQAQLSGHPEAAGPLYLEASTQFDGSIAAKPDVVALYLGKVRILLTLRGNDSTPGHDYMPELHSTVDKAQSLADFAKAPEEYKTAKQLWAQTLAMGNSSTEAKEVYEQLIAKFPDDLQLRLELSRILERANRPADALVVLNAISTMSGPSVTDIARRSVWDAGVANANLVRANVEIDQLVNTPPGKAHDDLAKDIAASLAAARKLFEGRSQLLRVQGRFEMVMGQKIEAIDTLTQAAEKMTVEGNGIDYELLRNEAKAYADGGQTSKAIELLERAMATPVVASNNEMNLTLAQLCLQNRDPVRAKHYIDWLAARYPKEPQVVLLEIAELGPEAKWDPDVKKFYDNLLEETPADRDVKSRIALQYKNSDESIRLLTRRIQDEPHNVEMGMQLASLLKQAGKAPEAMAVLDKLIELNADRPLLRVARDEMAGVKTAEQVEQLTYDQILKVSDPFAREKTLVKFFKLQERTEDEIVHLKKALEIQPNDKELLTILFMLYVEGKQFKDAGDMLPHLTEVNADDAHALILKTKLAIAMNDIPSAILYSKQMTQDREMANLAGSWEMYGEALECAGELGPACEQYNAALLLQATNVDARTHLINCSVRQGKIDEARFNLQSACRQFPSDTTYRNMRQRFEIQYGDPESILKELKAQVEHNPNETIGYALDVEALEACVRLKASQGDAATAKEYQQRAIDLLKEAMQHWPDNLGFSFTLAQAYAQSDDPKDAETVMETVVALPRWKDQARPQILLGQIYDLLRKYDHAEAAFSQALRAQPSSVEARLDLADALVADGKPDDAEGALYEYLANLPIHVKYISLLLQGGKFELAERDVANALKSQPNSPALTNLMLEVYFAEGKRAEGIKLATDALASNHADVGVYAWRAKLGLLGATPDLEGAVKDLGSFLNLVPGDAQGRLLLAHVLDSKHDRDGAIRELESALKFAPDDKSIRLYLVNEYLQSTPPRPSDAERLLQTSLAVPSMAHDPEFETQLALIQAKRGDKDQAVATMQDAMAHSTNKEALVGTYFNVLLLTKNYDLLLTESNKYVASPGTRWFVFSDRGVAKAGLGDTKGATAEFNTALDRAGAAPESGRSAPLQVTQAISSCDKLGPAKALELVLPRAENSTLWRLVAVELLVNSRDMAGAMKQIDAALSSIDKLNAADQMHLLELASNVYVTAEPPQVEKALDIYHRRLKIQPNDVGAMNDLACILVDMSVPPNPVEALDWSKKAYDLSKDGGQLETRIADTYGWVLIQNGRAADGIKVLHEAVDQFDFPEGHYHLAMGYIRKGDPGDAGQELDTAWKLYQDRAGKHEQVDSTLPAKLDAAKKQVEVLNQAKADGKAAPSGQ